MKRMQAIENYNKGGRDGQKIKWKKEKEIEIQNERRAITHRVRRLDKEKQPSTTGKRENIFHNET